MWPSGKHFTAKMRVFIDSLESDCSRAWYDAGSRVIGSKISERSRTIQRVSNSVEAATALIALVDVSDIGSNTGRPGGPCTGH